MNIPSEKDFAKSIEHTLLSPYATNKDITKLVEDALNFEIGFICVHPCRVTDAIKIIDGRDLKITTVIGFPLGANTTNTKIYETRDVIEKGADEIDMVMNIGKFKEKNYNYIEHEIREIVRQGKPVKVIIEVGFLTDNEKMEISRIIERAGAKFVKTSTGFGPIGAFPRDIEIIRSVISSSMGIKAAGGIRSAKQAIILMNKGANRIGTSTGPNIVKEFRSQKEKLKELNYENDLCDYCKKLLNYKKLPINTRQYYQKLCKKCSD